MKRAVCEALKDSDPKEGVCLRRGAAHVNAVDVDVAARVLSIVAVVALPALSSAASRTPPGPCAGASAAGRGRR